MIKSILNNLKTALTIVRDNPKVVFFVLVMLGFTGGGTYFSMIPPHPHQEQDPKETTVINKTIINKMECDSKCIEKISAVVKKEIYIDIDQRINKHDRTGHLF